MLNRRIIGLLFIAATAWAAAAGIALAGNPPASPQEIKTVNFEAASYPSGFTAGAVPLSNATSWWGRVPGHGVGSSVGLWIAGTGGTWPYYEPSTASPSGKTSGIASLDVSALTDYYSSQLTFSYIMPSELDRDYRAEQSAFAVGWTYSPATSSVTNHTGSVELPKSSTWLQKSWSLSDPVSAGQQASLSRLPGIVEFSFTPNLGIPSGDAAGPTVDDILVTGYKYGPVTGLATASDPSGIKLTWTRPVRSTAPGAAAEERTIAYRVWRQDSGLRTYTEVSPVGGIDDSATSWVDTSASNTGKYWYFIQAWDPASGPGYGALSSGVGINGPLPPAPPAQISVQGTTRYDTGVASSQKGFPTAGSASGVVVCTGTNFADALSAAALAGATDGPLLLTNPFVLSPAVSAEISRVRKAGAPVYVVGGTGAVFPGVETSLKALVGDASVHRISGPDRYATAAEVARNVKTITGSVSTVYIAVGTNCADALAVSPIAFSLKRPILLTRTASLPPATAKAIADIGATSAVIAGGTGAVSADVDTALKGAGLSTSRIAGANRYDTAKRIADYANTQGIKAETVAVATGQNFPDALGGGAMAGKLGGVMLLTKTASLEAEPSAYLTANKSTINNVYFLGGTGAISTTVRIAVANLLK